MELKWIKTTFGELKAGDVFSSSIPDGRSGYDVIFLRNNDLLLEGTFTNNETVYRLVSPEREALESMCYQFAYAGKDKNGRLTMHTAGLSALEEAFAVLGWPDPKPDRERECEYPDCHEFASCGRPTPEGYKRLCGKHYSEYDNNSALEVKP